MKKYLFLVMFVGMILLSSTIVLADTYITNRFLHVKLDTDDLVQKEIWEVHGTDDKGHDCADVSDYKYDSTYVCGMFITEEVGGFTDSNSIAWANDKSLIKKSGTSLESDLSGRYYECTGPAAGPCGACSWSNLARPRVFGASYSTGWADQCGFGTCDLSKSNTEYRPKYDILCNKESDGTGKWYICRDYSSCLGSWACDSSASTWTNCAASGKTCSAGSCVTSPPPVTCTSPSSYSNSNNCQSGGCYWCAPPAYSGFCAALSSDCKATCTYTGNSITDDASCADTCDTGGCNLMKNVCLAGGTCGYSMTSKFCGIDNSCAGSTSCYASSGSCSGGGGGSTAGGCSWYSSTFGVCSSGCPTSYPNQQYTCCASAGGGCNSGTSACASYDPIQGQTPCCTAGGYYTCTKQEICTEGGCKNVCTGSDKTSDLYCSKCSSCQDGVQNCA